MHSVCLPGFKPFQAYFYLKNILSVQKFLNFSKISINLGITLLQTLQNSLQVVIMNEHRGLQELIFWWMCQRF